MTAAQVQALPDDAPATMCAAGPVSPYEAGFEDAIYPDGRWACSWPAGSLGAQRYAQGWQDGKRQQQQEVRQ